MFIFSLMSYIIPVLLAIVTSIYLYFQYAFTYWKKRGVPYVEPSFPFGNTKEIVLRKMCFGKHLESIYNELKTKTSHIGGFYLLYNPVLMPLDPQLIKNIFSTDFSYFTERGLLYNEENDPLSGNLIYLGGERWKRMRIKTTPNFTSNKMKAMFGIMKTCSEVLDPILKDYIKNGQSVDIWDLVSRYTTDNIGSCAFGIDCNSTKTTLPEFRHYGRIFLTTSFSDPITIISGILFRSVFKFFNVKITSKSVSDFFLNAFKEVVHYREKNNIHRNDFLDFFIKLKQKEYVDDEGQIKKNDEPLTDNEIAAQAFGTFLGGYESSATTMSFCFLELALNQDIQRKLRREMLDVLKKHNGEITYDSIMDMTYMDQVIDETLRKYPVAPIVIRECVKDYTIPGTDTILEKGVQCWIPIIGIHKDPQYYPDPERFDPERFTKEEKDKRHPCVHLPFSYGLRMCIGKKFAMIQIKICLTKLLRNNIFYLDPKTVVPPEIMNTGLLYLQKSPVWLYVKRADEENI